MNLTEAMTAMLPAIEAELKEVVYGCMNAAYPELRDMLTYHLGWEGEGAGPAAQGKRIRPVMTLLCAQAAGGDWRSALPAAAAVELLHNFSLIHDDIQDNSSLRRGRPTVWVKWGLAQAINAGDVMYTLAYWALQRLAHTCSPQTGLEANRLLQEVCLRLTEGQYLDISYERLDNLKLENYWPMITGKTSALLGGCAELGALAGGASREQRDAFREFGIKVGLAFQVLDDWLGIWGDAALTGKSTDSDLVAGKKSLPVVYALEKQGAFKRRWRRDGVRPEDVPEMAALLEKEGAGAYTLAQAENLTHQAYEALKRAVGEAEDASQLEEMVGMLLARKY